MMNRRVFLTGLTGLAVLAAISAGAAGDERILSYHSDIRVGVDRWLTVTETIRVRCEGKEIERGIYRDFPVRYKGRRDFRTVLVPFEVVSVRRDGKPEPFHTKRESDSVMVYMGKEGRFLKDGEYTYELTYRTRRQLGFFEKHDELYWNVTGNEWKFPIDRATAAVTLPRGIAPAEIGHEAYTGPKGAKGKAYRSSVDKAGVVRFETTAPLGKGEGLTIVATFPKGVIPPPTGSEALAFFFRDNSIVLAGVVGLIVVAGYYVVAWVKVGRDPATGVIFPQFKAPEDLCPAAVRYVLRMGFDKTCFAASVINLAVKGELRIEDDDGAYQLVNESGEGRLSQGERKVSAQLFSGGSPVELEPANHSRFQKAIKDLKKTLTRVYEGRYFHSNFKWFIAGVVLSVLTLAGVALTGAFVEGRFEIAFLGVWLTFWSFGVFALVRGVIAAWSTIRRARSAGETAVSTGAAVFLTIFAVPFVGAEIGVASVLVYMTSIWLLPVLLLLGLANVGFFHLLKRPTREGRKVMDGIEGFRMYLGTAEQDLLETAHGPERTPELFEKFLPYAIALDVENAWAERFRDVLDRAAATSDGYSPDWYHGSAWGALGAGAFASAFSNSFSSALSSASTPPGSSSGSGGGGSSGGGGGGGGGGGW